MNKEEAKSETQNQNPNSNAANPNNPNQGYKVQGKVKSCKGCLYYSSALKSKSQKPTCVGIARTLQQVPSFMTGEFRLKASEEGRTPKDFKYACVGYSVYLDNNDSSTLESDKHVQLPFCVGFEAFAYPTPTDQVPANTRKKEDSHTLPQPQPQLRPQTHRSTQSTGDEFYDRFKRNAGIVASGVAKNLNKIGNQIKETLDDILNRRPK